MKQYVLKYSNKILLMIFIGGGVLLSPLEIMALECGDLFLQKVNVLIKKIDTEKDEKISELNKLQGSYRSLMGSGDSSIEAKIDQTVDAYEDRKQKLSKEVERFKALLVKSDTENRTDLHNEEALTEDPVYSQTPNEALKDKIRKRTASESEYAGELYPEPPVSIVQEQSKEAPLQPPIKEEKVSMVSNYLEARVNQLTLLETLIDKNQITLGDALGAYFAIEEFGDKRKENPLNNIRSAVKSGLLDNEQLAILFRLIKEKKAQDLLEVDTMILNNILPRKPRIARELYDVMSEESTRGAYDKGRKPRKPDLDEQERIRDEDGIYQGEFGIWKDDDKN